MASQVFEIDPSSFAPQSYTESEFDLVSSSEIATSFTSQSYIEFFIYDGSNNISYRDYNFSQYVVLNNGQSAQNGEIFEIQIELNYNIIKSLFTNKKH